MRREARRPWGSAWAVVLFLTGCSNEPELRLADAWRITGHHDVRVEADGSLTPVSYGEAVPPRACVASEATTDTSQWVGGFGYGAAPEDDDRLAPPERRMGGTLCFTIPQPLEATDSSFEICGRLFDRYSGQRLDLPCRRVLQRLDVASYDAIRAKVGQILSRQAELPGPRLGALLEEIEAEANSSELPFLALRIRTIAAFYYRQGRAPEDATAAARLLNELPPWIDRPEASEWAAQIAVERASLALLENRLRDAWNESRSAETAYSLTAHPKTLTAVTKRAEVLARVGALGDARRLLHSALEQCATSPCDPPFIPHAKITLAWWVAQDPEATLQELGEAHSHLEATLQNDETEGLDRANLLLNRALLETRLDRDSIATLEDIEAITSSHPGDRARELVEWTELLRATTLLGRDDHGALLAAREVADATRSSRIAAWAQSLLGQAYRRLGDLEAAGLAFSQTLELHRHSGSDTLGLEVPVGSSQRAEDYLRAARLALERDRPADAWQTLIALDALSLGSSDECGNRRPESAEREALVQELIDLGRPAAATRKAQRESIRRAVLTELQEIDRRRVDCGESFSASLAPEARFRAFLLDDQAWLLERRTPREIVLVRRAPLSRDLLRELEAFVESAGESPEAWTDRLLPVTRALLPEDLEALSSVTTFALHGPLQVVPLSALPVSGTGTRRLADLTTVVHRPVGAVTGSAARRPDAGKLFVLDPGGDLPGSSESAGTYGGLFPDARLLLGADARREATLEALAGIGWLHIGAHGSFDPAFPDLSEIQMADAPLFARDITSRATDLEFANLSTCFSGRYPITADSGRHGLAGLLARAGAGWIVASRTLLSDTLAQQFNHFLYRELANGGSVPEAYAAALREVRDRFPVAEWSALMLIGTENQEMGGQNDALSTPKSMEPEVPPSSGGRE